jgi:acyl-coenzyme A thioesterase PaaI-like protein
VSGDFEAGVRISPHDPGPNPAADSPQLARRRAAVAALGHEVRELVDAVVGTEVPAEDLERCVGEVRALTARLRRSGRDRGELASVDDLHAGVRMYNLVSGAGNPLSPPMRVELGDGTAEAGGALGLAHEGPPSYGHGGVSALLLDHVLGGAAAASGNPGMTVELAVRYRHPVPLRTPLLVRGATVDVDGRWIRANGSIAAAEAPDRALVTAEAKFVSLNPDQVRRLFPG